MKCSRFSVFFFYGNTIFGGLIVIVSTVIFFNNSFHYIIKNQSVKRNWKNNETLSEKESYAAIFFHLQERQRSEAESD